MIIYDKLKNVKTDETKFDFICPSCGVNGMKKDIFEIKPIGISWKPDFVDNSDIENIPLRKAYDRLPILRNAIMVALGKNESGGSLSIHCNKCKTYIVPTQKVIMADLRKWINRNLPYFMDLRKKEE